MRSNRFGEGMEGNYMYILMGFLVLAVFLYMYNRPSSHFGTTGYGNTGQGGLAGNMNKSQKYITQAQVKKMGMTIAQAKASGYIVI